MHKFTATLLLILAYTLISCVAENSNDSTPIELSSPASTRQVIALTDIEWRALIQVNSGPAQDFFFNNSDSPLSVNIKGVQRDEENNIFIKWFEILHGHRVEISVQSQDFVADGSTIIDTAHVYTQFDYDGDGISNLDERSAGTCVWSSTETCVNEGQTDIPTDNALLNGDFSDGIRYWISNPPVISETSGEYCVNSPATAIERWDARFDYSPLSVFIDANSSYSLVFDVRAQTSSKVFIQLLAKISDSYKTLVDTTADVSTTYETKSIRYESAANAYDEGLLGFTFGNGSDNTYCFDNIKLIREISQ